MVQLDQPPTVTLGRHEKAALRGRTGLLTGSRLRRLRGHGPKWWLEATLIGLCYWAYTLTRNAVPDHEVAATHRATAVLRVERALHVNIELTVNHAVASVRWLAVGMNYYYATLHFVVTIGVLIWLFARKPRHYRSASTALFAATGLALVGFYLFALAPPRFLVGQGFVDTVATLHTWGSFASGDVAAMSNQYAAMPSLHIGWSLWSAITLVRLARRRWVRALAALYPVATLAVILGTANHFVFDALGGVVVLAAGFATQRVLLGRPAYRQVVGPTPPRQAQAPRAETGNRPGGLPASVAGRPAARARTAQRPG